MKEEKGAITLFVLMACIFFIIILLITNIGLINKNMTQEKYIDGISKIYSVNESDLERAYENAVDESRYLNKGEIKDLMEKYVEEEKTKILDQAIQDAKSQLYPVGSIYISVEDKNPGELFGGTWVSWGSGRVPVGVSTADTEFNKVEKIGGDKNMQSHTHLIPSLSGTTNSTGEHSHTYIIHNTQVMVPKGDYYGVMSHETISQKTNNVSSHTHTVTTTASVTGETGSGNAQNLQPYITCYMWKRTE